MSKESKHVTAFRLKHQKPGEVIVVTAEGYIGEMMGSGKNTQHNGTLVVTDQRVAFIRKGLFGDVFQSIPLSKVTSVERRTNLGICSIVAHTSHDDLAFKTFDRASFDAAAVAIESGRDGGGSTAQAPAAAVGADPVQRLQQLQRMLDSGLLSQDEYNDKKAEILAGI
jgi:hypothetical protein